MIGPTLPDQPVCPEMAIRQQKMRPGSGCLTVRLLMDGPTRMLQVTDLATQKSVLVDTAIEATETYLSAGQEVEEQQAEQMPQHLEVDQCGSLFLKKRKNPFTFFFSKIMLFLHASYTYNTLQVLVELPAGLGISLVNSWPEELVYVSLRNIQLDYHSSEAGQLIEATIKNIQVSSICGRCLLCQESGVLARGHDNQKPWICFLCAGGQPAVWQPCSAALCHAQQDW